MTRANVSDRDGASAMIALHAMHLRQVQNVLEPGSYLLNLVELRL